MKYLRFFSLTLGAVVSLGTYLGLTAKANAHHEPGHQSTLQWSNSNQVSKTDNLKWSESVETKVRTKPQWSQVNTIKPKINQENQNKLSETEHLGKVVSVRPESGSRVELTQSRIGTLNQANLNKKAELAPVKSENIQSAQAINVQKLNHNSVSVPLAKIELSKAQTAVSEPKLQINPLLGIIKPDHRAVIMLAQDSSDTVGESLVNELLIDPLTETKVSYPGVPASTLGVPTGFGAMWGNAFVGGFFTSARRNNPSSQDASMALGIGFGDAFKAVGVELDLGILSLEDDFADSGQVGIKISRILDRQARYSLAIGWANPITWGAANDAKDTIYGAFSGRFLLQPENKSNKQPVSFTLGVGSGDFRSVGAIDADKNTPNVFGSLSWRFVPEISSILTWTGSELNAGLSVAPFDFPLVFKVGVADLTSNFEDSGPRLILSAGYAINF